MKCEELNGLLDQYLDGELPEEASRRIDRHLMLSGLRLRDKDTGTDTGVAARGGRDGGSFSWFPGAHDGAPAGRFCRPPAPRPRSDRGTTMDAAVFAGRVDVGGQDSVILKAN